MSELSNCCVGCDADCCSGVWCGGISSSPKGVMINGKRNCGEMAAKPPDSESGENN